MGKLLLTSAGFTNPQLGKVFLQLAEKPAPELRVLFIPTAAVTEEQKKYVAESREELVELGIPQKNIITYDLDYPLPLEEAVLYDAVYVCGGSTVHLLQKIREMQFDRLLEQMIHAGIVYVGVSAGSIVLGPRVKEEKGLEIVHTQIVPHYTLESHGRVEELRSKSKHTITPLRDQQALLVRGDEYSVVE